MTNEKYQTKRAAFVAESSEMIKVYSRAMRIPEEALAHMLGLYLFKADPTLDAVDVLRDFAEKLLALAPTGSVQ